MTVPSRGDDPRIPPAPPAGGKTGNSFGSRATIDRAGTSYQIHRLNAVAGAQDLPFSLKVLLENLLRTEDGVNVTADHIRALAGWD
ncbi:MAG: hypothetical protein ACRDRO_02910, partial [Pseudonocardiaceae bacterium]